MKNYKKSKIKFSHNSLKGILKYLKKYSVLIIISIMAAILSAILQIIGPDKLRQITDEITKGLPSIVNGEVITENINLLNISNIIIILLILYVTSFLLHLIQSFIITHITMNISNNLREDINNKINRLPFSYFDKINYGDLLSRVTNDVDTISQSLNQSIITLITGLVMLVGSIIMMLFSSIILTITTITSSLFGFIFIAVIMTKSQKYFSKEQSTLGEINGYVEELYTAHSVVKMYDLNNKTREKFISINNKLFNFSWKAQFLSGLMMPVMQFVGNFSYVVVCVIGAILALNGSITFGVIVAFMIYIRLFNQPLSQIAESLNSIQRAIAAGDRVIEFLSEDEMESDENKSKLLSKVKGKVEFKNVRFGYTKDNIIINNFSVKVNAGDKVAIVGPTGAGKTTIVNLLMRFYELNSGNIFIDDVDIRTITKESLRSNFCMVLQDSWLFEASVKENIIFGSKNVSDEKLIEVCKKVNLHHFIMTLPNGYETLLTDKDTISQGQKQLLTIARAMISDAPILILDEATSSVDTRTEVIVQKAMDELASKRTSFVIAHRLSTIKNADLILVMKDGDIVEKGRHENLLYQKGFYYNLYNSQFNNFK